MNSIYIDINMEDFLIINEFSNTKRTFTTVQISKKTTEINSIKTIKYNERYKLTIGNKM